MQSSPPAAAAAARRPSEWPCCKSSWFYRCSRTSAPLASDPTLFFPRSPLCECRTRTSHVDPCWLHSWFMTSKRELLTRTMCMSARDSCQAILSSLCRPRRHPLRVCWKPAHQQATTSGCGRHLASLSWVFNPLKEKKYMCFWLCSLNERVLKWLTLGATSEAGTIFKKCKYVWYQTKTKVRRIEFFRSIINMTEAFPWSLMH